jgi:hypothetical protein
LFVTFAIALKIFCGIVDVFRAFCGSGIISFCAGLLERLNDEISP